MNTNLVADYGMDAELVWMCDNWSCVQCGNELLIHRHDYDRVVDVATLKVDGLGWDWEERSKLLPIILYAMSGSTQFAHRVTEYADLS